MLARKSMAVDNAESTHVPLFNAEIVPISKAPMVPRIVEKRTSPIVTGSLIRI
jgi:hypothetical protein